MTKLNVLKEAKEIITGRSYDHSILIWKEGRSWKTESDFDSCDLNECQKNNGIILRYENNKEYTLKEVALLIENKMKGE